MRVVGDWPTAAHHRVAVLLGLSELTALGGTRLAHGLEQRRRVGQHEGDATVGHAEWNEQHAAML